MRLMGMVGQGEDHAHPCGPTNSRKWRHAQASEDPLPSALCTDNTPERTIRR